MGNRLVFLLNSQIVMLEKQVALLLQVSRLEKKVLDLEINNANVALELEKFKHEKKSYLRNQLRSERRENSLSRIKRQCDLTNSDIVIDNTDSQEDDTF